MKAPAQGSPALLFGVPIDDLTMNETVQVVGDLIRHGRDLHRSHQIATVNVDFLVNAARDEHVRELLQQADVCLPDGMPVRWAARAAGMPLRERVTGADLVPALAERAATLGWKIHLFGSGEGVAHRSAELLRLRFPGALVTADSGPALGSIAHVDEAVAAALVAADPDILCVALGNPKQERFIDVYRHVLRTPVLIGIGGALDLLAGDRRRAPRWVQRAGLEWVVRAAQEPTRLGRRYAHDAKVFVPQLARYIRQVQKLGAASRLSLSLGGTSPSPVDNIGSVRARMATTVESSTPVHTAVESLRHGAFLELDIGDIEQLTLPALAELIGLLRAARRYDSVVKAAPLHPTLRNQIEELGLGSYLAHPETFG